MYIKSHGSLSTVGIWMIMPLAVQVLSGYLRLKPYSKNALKLALLFSRTIVTPLNAFPNLLTKLLPSSHVNPSPRASPLSVLPFRTYLSLHTYAYALAHAVLFFTHRFSPFIPILRAVNTHIFFHFFILLLANVSAKLFFSLTFLFLLLISPYSIPPPGGVRFSRRLLQC